MLFGMSSYDTVAQTPGGQALRYLDLGDERREARAAAVLTALLAHPEAALPHALADPAAAKAAYRFLENPAVDPAAIRAAHHARTRDAIRRLPRVLFLQDTTSFDFTAHPATTGLGPLECARHQGFFQHATLAVTPEGVPLGLVDQQLLLRDPQDVGKARTRKQRPLADKESRRWLDACTASHQDLSPALETLTIADREADIYALFAQPRPPHAHLLVRVGQQHRRVTTAPGEVQPLWAALDAVPPEPGFHTATVARRPGQEPRTALLTVRCTTVQLSPPRGQTGPSLPVTVLRLDEVAAPAGVTPVCWLLATTWPVADWATMVQLADWYALRWLIERLHYILKSGCTLERLQLQGGPALLRAHALYSMVACDVLRLTYLGRLLPDAPCTVVLTDEQWPVLVAATCPDAAPPTEPPTLAEATRLIARLGGHLGRKGDGPPGPKTLWRGWRALDLLVQGARLVQTLAPPGKAHFVGNK